MMRAVRAFALTAGLAVLLAAPASAQLAIGLTGGVNTSTLTGSDADAINASSKTGGAGGAYANIYLGHRFSVEGQLLFSGQGFSADSGGSSVSVTQGYIELPALLKVYFGHLNIFAGPAISWKVSCSADVTNVDASCNTANSSLWSGIAGAGLQFGKLGVEAHYQSGFSDTFEGLNASYGAWYFMGRLALLGSR